MSPLADGSHLNLAGVPFFVDESYQGYTGTRAYEHGGRSILGGRTDVTGNPAAQNLKDDYLVWALTRFDGEGQVVLDPSDSDSQFRFYRSEGLDFRTSGQAQLNKSIVSESLSVAAAASTTRQGNADFTDITGTSTGSGTDRRLNVVGDKVGASADYTPGATVAQADFYVYRDTFNTGATTIEANAFVKDSGSPITSGTDLLLNGKLFPDLVRSANLVTGTAFTAGVTTRVDFYGNSSTANIQGESVSISIYDVTNNGFKLVTSNIFQPTNTAGIQKSLSFVPVTGRTYRIYVGEVSFDTSTYTFDKVIYGPEITANTVTLEIWNQSAGTSVTTKTVTVDAQAAGTVVGSITWTAAAATNYRPRIARTSGQQKPWLDQVVLTAKANAAYVFDCTELGLRGNVWAGAHLAASDSKAFKYNAGTDTWDDTTTFTNDAATTNAAVLAMCHSDSLEYFLLNNNTVYTSTNGGGGGGDRYAWFAAASRTLVGMCVCQNNLWLMADDSSGTTIYAIPLDTTFTPITLNDLKDSTTAVVGRSVTIASGSKSSFPSLGGITTQFTQRMASTPNGVRVFINYGDVSAKVFNIDGSGTTLVPTELTDMGAGVIATAITYEGGTTFIAGTYYGDWSSSDVTKKPKTALFALDTNNVFERIGFFRRDDPDTHWVQDMDPYQTDLFILQGKYVWRYSLISGGLYLEYQLEPKNADNARAMATLGGRAFVMYSDEVFVSGTVGTFRQSSVSGGNTFTSSIFDFGLPFVKKVLTKLQITTNTMPSNSRVSIEYQADQSGNWVLAGNITGGSTQTFPIQDVLFSTLQVRATLASFDGVGSPVMKSIVSWCYAADDEEYFDLVLRAGDDDSYDHVDGNQYPGTTRFSSVISAWRAKAVTTLVDGYQLPKGNTTGDTYNVVIQDLRDERDSAGEGRLFLSCSVVK